MSVKEYKGFKIEESKGVDFGQPKFIKYGKEIDIQEYIDAGREDTEIYPTLLKYGCLKPLECDVQGIYGDFTELNDLRMCADREKKCNEMWDQLPIEIKNQFNNSKHEFVDRGMEWAQNQIKKEQEQSKPAGTGDAEPKGE